MDVKIKTFRIQSSADEQTLNDFLTGKIVRHWSTTYEQSPEGGVWNVFLGYEIRMNENRPTGGDRDRRDAPRGATNHGRDVRPERRGDDRPPMREPREKTPREDYVPLIAEGDKPLFEAVRKWRNARAKDERIKPFALFNNKQLEAIVNAKPVTAETLRPLAPDMDDRLWERYHNELLGFMEAAASINGGAHVAETTHQEAPVEVAA
ncbi:MAG: HRDC domain-containing protein [Bacteroidota bacterium]|nr:HRDC domain-containing protein [Bacteroidota bacterium]MDP4233808.1 HRDC domain-containing protein [Bacteroidota bacterium]MDP4242447.1 HRDC domain-containing protein [Bacteroidota bacterium]MDP4287569.1 HRDC domain-containing protein [Bacteroidota bacterium]